jgi:membrane-associated phospholipid phosphatase
MHSATQAPESPRGAAWVGLVVAGILLGLFLGWTLIIQPGVEPPPVDWRFAESMKEYEAVHPHLRNVFIFFTMLGSPWGLGALATLGVLGCVVLKEWHLALIWVVAAGGGALVDLAVKAAVDRPRPSKEMRHDLVKDLQSQSYPSGHSMGSAIGFGMIAYAALLVVRRRAWRIALVAVIVVIVLLVGTSRIFLRAHWFSDVIAGFLLGGAWLALCLSALAWWQRRSARSP